ncbi:MAG: class I SAM-dependent rRNA methyltransferase [Myxococcota bacterium]
MAGTYRAAPPAGGRLVVNAYSEKWLRQGFPWVYPNEVVAGRPRAGEVVTLASERGDVLGVGLADEGWIAARRFREDAGPVDAVLVAERIAAARRRREGVLPPRTDAFRLVNAENDDLPGVRVDVWGAHAVVTLDSPALRALVEPICDALDAASVHLAFRPDPRDRIEVPAGRLVRGDDPGEVRVEERGVAFLVRPGDGKDVGLFPDMRDNRAWLQPHWEGRSLLNLFAHTGAFSVCAALGGAETVSVDLSPAYLERAAANFRANGLAPHELLAEDAFKALDRFRRQGRPFDVVLLDPPGHSHAKEGVWSGEQDYARLVAAALRVLRPGGWLVAASNLGSVSPHRFQGMLLAGAQRAQKRLRLLHDGGQAPDFCAALHFPEGRYLKFMVCVTE